MAFARRFLIAVCLAGAALGCSSPAPAPAPVAKKAPKKEGKDKKSEGKHAKAAPAEPQDPGKFTVPFAWEAAKDEPLAQTRAFLSEVLTDNERYMDRDEKFFAAFAEKQTPRATVITCADSRVHSPAWDATPENDDFTIRNIGNQVENNEGSVEYGIEHLHTPLLLIIGHTGCGAVKAAMGDISGLAAPIQKELEHLHPPKAEPGKAPDVAWAEAVVANVNSQVEFARKRFGKEIQAGQLTVVGAVYDFRNDLGRGAGKLAIVNVNGNSEPERMSAFVDAVTGAREGKVALGKEGKEKDKKRKGAKEEAGLVEDTAAQLARLRSEAGVQVRTASVATNEPKPTEHASHSAPHGEHAEHAAHAD